jgi:hypothetical protein
MPHSPSISISLFLPPSLAPTPIPLDVTLALCGHFHYTAQTNPKTTRQLTFFLRYAHARVLACSHVRAMRARPA